MSRYMNERAKPGIAYVPTKCEHFANMLTHALSIAPSAAALLWMLRLSETRLQLVSALVYGFALIALFTMSTLFHVISYSGKYGIMQKIFHIGDRAIIYVFIAASYTPWLVLRDAGTWSAYFMWLVWMMAVFGILYQWTYHEKFRSLDTVFYLIIGLCPAIAILAMNEYSGLHEVALGGVAYMVGVIFFKCDGRIPFAHAIWHCFVMTGAILQFFAVTKYLFRCPLLHSLTSDNQNPTSFIHSDL